MNGKKLSMVTVYGLPLTNTFKANSPASLNAGVCEKIS